MEVEKTNVLGVGISVLDQDRAREFLFEAARTGKRGYVTVTGVHGVSEAQNDPELKSILNGSLLCTPDGMPMVWMGRMQGHDSIRRVYGPDLMLNLCEHSGANGFRHFLFGGKPGVADSLSANLQSRFPGLNYCGHLLASISSIKVLTNSRNSRPECAKRRPDFFWVGLSTPKQERFMAAHLDLLAGGENFHRRRRGIRSSDRPCAAGTALDAA